MPPSFPGGPCSPPAGRGKPSRPASSLPACSRGVSDVLIIHIFAEHTLRRGRRRHTSHVHSRTHLHTRAPRPGTGTTLCALGHRPPPPPHPQGALSSNRGGVTKKLPLPLSTVCLVLQAPETHLWLPDPTFSSIIHLFPQLPSPGWWEGYSYKHGTN